VKELLPVLLNDSHG